MSRLAAAHNPAIFLFRHAIETVRQRFQSCPVLDGDGGSLGLDHVLRLQAMDGVGDARTANSKHQSYEFVCQRHLRAVQAVAAIKSQRANLASIFALPLDKAVWAICVVKTWA